MAPSKLCEGITTTPMRRPRKNRKVKLNFSHCPCCLDSLYNDVDGKRKHHGLVCMNRKCPNYGKQVMTSKNQFEDYGPLAKKKARLKRARSQIVLTKRKVTENEKTQPTK